MVLALIALLAGAAIPAVMDVGAGAMPNCRAIEDCPGANADTYDEPPRMIKNARPKYPLDAFNKSIEGTVELEILIDARGRVAHARVVKSIPLLDRAALQCVSRWQFAPARKDGDPVATLAFAPITFRISDKPKKD